MSLSLAITANPDVLSLDGASQSQITIEARDANGQPAANVPLRVEIVPTAVGRLRITVGANVGDGQQRARLVYVHRAAVVAGQRYPRSAASA